MRILFGHRRELMGLLERLNEKGMCRDEAILLRMCRV
jgi:hypothetical protein